MNRKSIPFLLAAILACAVLFIYWATFKYPFILLDDADQIARNPLVNGGLNWNSFCAAFKPSAAQWMPLTWITLMAQVSLWGLAPGPMHSFNVALHAGSSVLLFFWLRSMTGRTGSSFAVAALFAVHPINVESVAWAIELKNCLSMAFALLALWLYAAHSKAPSPKLYFGCLAAFALSIMSKSMTIALPFLLLFLDFWPLNRLSMAAVKEKIPFFILSGVGCLLVIAGALYSPERIGQARIPWGITLPNVPIAYICSLGQLMVPIDFALPHPLDPVRTGWAFAAGCLAIMALVSLVCFRLRESRPYLLFGWLWFLVALLPTGGLFQVGYQSWADRFTYFGQLGLFIALVWLLQSVAGRHLAKVGVAGLILLACLLAAAKQQVGYWRDSKTLFIHGAEVMPENSIVRFYAGKALAQAGDTKAAAAYYYSALKRAPQFGDAWLALGECLLQLGQYRFAQDALQTAARLHPDSAQAQSLLAVAREKAALFPTPAKAEPAGPANRLP